jgi:transcriptional regulator with XRE-family HTH domain
MKSLITIDEEVSQVVNQVIRLRRIALGLSQQQLADLCGVKRSYVCDVERGARCISLNSLFRFAKGLGMKPSQLVLTAEINLNERNG